MIDKFSFLTKKGKREKKNIIKIGRLSVLWAWFVQPTFFLSFFPSLSDRQLQISAITALLDPRVPPSLSLCNSNLVPPAAPHSDPNLYPSLSPSKKSLERERPRNPKTEPLPLFLRERKWQRSKGWCFAPVKMLNFLVRKDVRKILKRKDSDAGERGNFCYY